MYNKLAYLCFFFDRKSTSVFVYSQEFIYFGLIIHSDRQFRKSTFDTHSYEFYLNLQLLHKSKQLGGGSIWKLKNRSVEFKLRFISMQGMQIEQVDM